MALEDFCDIGEPIAEMLVQTLQLDKNLQPDRKYVQWLRQQISPTLHQVYLSFSPLYRQVMDLDDMYWGDPSIIAAGLGIPLEFVSEYLEDIHKRLEPHISTIKREIKERAANTRLSPNITLQ